MSFSPIRNLLFDLGGVILNIDPQLTVDAFRKLGWQSFFDENEKELNKDLFYNLEMGNSSPDLFREKIRAHLPEYTENEAIDAAWSAMILDIPASRIQYIEALKKNYRIFLLSNTNEIHRIKFHKIFEDNFGYSFYNLFEKSFYSHEMGMRKPNPGIFLNALEIANISANETLFIDDMKENTNAAEQLGMHVLNILPGKLLETLPAYLMECK